MRLEFQDWKGVKENISEKHQRYWPSFKIHNSSTFCLSCLFKLSDPNERNLSTIADVQILRRPMNQHRDRKRSKRKTIHLSFNKLVNAQSLSKTWTTNFPPTFHFKLLQPYSSLSSHFQQPKSGPNQYQNSLPTSAMWRHLVSPKLFLSLWSPPSTVLLVSPLLPG